jgi:hypothetical protein
MDLAPPFPKVEKGGKRWKKVEKGGKGGRNFNTYLV